MKQVEETILFESISFSAWLINEISFQIGTEKSFTQIKRNLKDEKKATE